MLKKDTISYPKIYFNGLSTRISDEELTKKLDEIKEIEEQIKKELFIQHDQTLHTEMYVSFHKKDL